MRSFVKKKSSPNRKITLSIIDIGKSCPSCNFFNVASMSFKALRENKILAKISGFTVKPQVPINFLLINLNMCLRYSLRRFFLVPTTYVLDEFKDINFPILTLIWRPVF